MAMRAIPSILALALVSGACKPKEPETNGIGPYVLGKTTLADGKRTARCQPSGDVTWCFGAPEIKVGSQPATVDLYFAGAADDAPLVEIVLSVRACNVDQVGASLARALGTPESPSATRRVWRKKLSFTLARLREGSTECEISFVDPRDQKRVDELTSGK